MPTIVTPDPSDDSDKSKYKVRILALLALLCDKEQPYRRGEQIQDVGAACERQEGAGVSPGITGEVFELFSG